MIALDANVSACDVVVKDRRQCESAKALVDDALARGSGIVVGLVPCELAWVLASAHDYSRHAITPFDP